MKLLWDKNTKANNRNEFLSFKKLTFLSK